MIIAFFSKLQILLSASINIREVANHPKHRFQHRNIPQALAPVKRGTNLSNERQRQGYGWFSLVIKVLLYVGYIGFKCLTRRTNSNPF